MADDESNYDPVPHDRTVVTLHEIGHLFDADHENATGQQETYNRAYQWGLIWKSQTVVWSYFSKDTTYEYSSDNYHGDVNHDNARRISETKRAVSNYKHNTDTIGVYRPSTATFYLRNSNSAGNPDLSFAYGISGDKPIDGDWIGQGKTTIGVYRPSTNTIYLRNSNSAGPADIAFAYGATGDIPIDGDWDGK